MGTRYSAAVRAVGRESVWIAGSSAAVASSVLFLQLAEIICHLGAPNALRAGWLVLATAGWAALVCLFVGVGSKGLPPLEPKAQTS